MATQTITATRWTCDTCGRQEDNLNAEEDEIMVGWGCIAISVPDEAEPITKDICPDCLGALYRTLKMN